MTLLPLDPTRLNYSPTLKYINKPKYLLVHFARTYLSHSVLLRSRISTGNRMTLHMQWQMIRSTESSFANMTLEWSVAGMLSEVSGKLVRPCELPFASRPFAQIGFFAWRKTIVIAISHSDFSSNTCSLFRSSQGGCDMFLFANV